MSQLLERKLNEIQESYTNLKLRMAGDNIWIYDNTPLNTAFNRILDFKEEKEEKETTSSFQCDGLNVTVTTSLNRTTTYKLLDNRTMYINGRLTVTDQEYTDGIISILNAALSSPNFVVELIEDKELLQLICEDEDGANTLCKYYTADLKYQSVMGRFSEAIDTMNEYCEKLDDEYVQYINKPYLEAVKNIMLSSSDMFTKVGSQLIKLYNATELLFEQPNIFDYIADTKDAEKLFSDIALLYDDSVYTKITTNPNSKITSYLWTNPNALKFMSTQPTYYEDLLYNHADINNLADIMESKASLFDKTWNNPKEYLLENNIPNPKLNTCFVCSWGLNGPINTGWSQLYTWGHYNSSKLCPLTTNAYLSGTNINCSRYVETCSSSDNLPIKIFKFYSSFNSSMHVYNFGHLYIKHFSY